MVFLHTFYKNRTNFWSIIKANVYDNPRTI